MPVLLNIASILPVLNVSEKYATGYLVARRVGLLLMSTWRWTLPGRLQPPQRVTDAQFSSFFIRSLYERCTNRFKHCLPPNGMAEDARCPLIASLPVGETAGVVLIRFRLFSCRWSPLRMLMQLLLHRDTSRRDIGDRRHDVIDLSCSNWCTLCRRQVNHRRRRWVHRRLLYCRTLRRLNSEL